MAILLCFPALIAAPAGAGDACTSSTPVASTYEPPLDPSVLLSVDDEIRAYFAPRVDRRGSVRQRIHQILVALLEDGLCFAYDPQGNYEAAESFRRRSGNCMSFALLFTAIAREYGLRPVFHQVQIEARWTLRSDFITHEGHINVLLRDGADRIQVDLDPLWEREIITGWETVISDTRAFALFYSNLGVERLALEDDAAALHLLHHATRVDPSSGVAWVNLANGLMHTGDMQGAEQALKRALALRPTEASATSAMARLCRITGRTEAAATFEKKAQRYRDRNPYYHYALARAAVSRADHSEATRHLDRAIGLKPDEPRFFELRIEIARALGREDEAQRWLKKLNALRQPGSSTLQFP